MDVSAFLASAKAGEEEGMVHEVQSSRHALDDSVQQLTACTSLDDFQVARASVLDAVTGLDESLDSCFGSINDETHKTTAASAAKATQVFDTPELLELVLVNLDSFDLLALQQVNGTMRDGIASSTRVGRLLGTLPHIKSSFYTPFNVWPPRSSFSCTIAAVKPEVLWTGTAVTFGETDPHLFEILAAFDMSQELPSLGERCRSMLICQPPVRQMDVRVACCGGTSQEHPHAHIAGYRTPPRLQVLQSESGITVGDIHDATKTLIEQHRLCPFAHGALLDDQGCVQSYFIGPQFTTRVHLGPGDAIFEREESTRAERAAVIAAQEAKTHRMEAYFQAKISAHYAGTKVPTLDEFEASTAGKKAGGNDDDT